MASREPFKLVATEPTVLFVPRCKRHNKLTGDGPGVRCFDSRCLAEASAAASLLAPTVEPAVKGERITKPKAKPKASPSRWAEYGQRGGRLGGLKTSPAKVAAARTNGVRGGRPRDAMQPGKVTQ